MEKITGAIKSAFRAWHSRFAAAGPKGKIGMGCGILLVLMCMCAVPLAIITPDSEPELEPAASERTQEIALVEDEESEPKDEPPSTEEPQATYSD